MNNNVIRYFNILILFFILVFSVNVTVHAKKSKTLGLQADLLFTDISQSANIGQLIGGHCAVFADVNNDSLSDLYITMCIDDPMSDLFFLNIGNNIFNEESALHGIDDFDGGSHGACFADLDNDGDYDLYNGTTLSTNEIAGVNNIFENDGNGSFTDITFNCGIPIRSWLTRGVTAFDMDGDGDLDLFGVTNYLGDNDPSDERNEIYRNNGNMNFTAINTGVLYTCRAGQGVIASDYDNDGDVDILIANRTGDVNILNNSGNGYFVKITPSNIGINHRAGDGINVADVDNDNIFDLLLTSDNIGYLYLGIGNGEFVYKRNFDNTDGYMGGFADLDNDGDLDLIFAGDDLCYLNDGSGNYTTGPSIPVSGINDPRSIGFSDIDNDGDLDFAVGVKKSRNFLIRNDFNDGNWLKINLISPDGQLGAFGAKIHIYPPGQANTGQLLGVREARGSVGYLGQDDPEIFFGLGSYGSVDVVVTFLNRSFVVKSNVNSHQTILIDGRNSVSQHNLRVINGSGSDYYNVGDIVNITANSSIINHVFDKWIGDSEYVSNVNAANTTVTMPDKSIEIIAAYKPINDNIDKWGVFELEFVANSELNNPYQENVLWATFVGPSTTLTLPGFWDGDSTWKVRVSPSETGHWTYFTVSGDSGLIVNGSFTCINSSMHGSITPMNNYPYHFQYEDGTPFWWFGETFWPAFELNSSENLTDETFKEYIDIRAAQGFNYIHGLLLVEGDGDLPFTGNKIINPLFWRRVDENIKYMNDRGITCGLMLAWKYGGGDDWISFEDEEARRNYSRYVASRYSAYNITWILAGEYNEAPTEPPNTNADWQVIADAIAEGDPYGRMMSIHVAGSAEALADESWNDFGDYMQIYEDIHETVLNALDHNKPVVNSEYGYFLRDKDEDGIVDKPNSATREEFRHATWDIVMAGGYFVTGFGSTYGGGNNHPGDFNVHDPLNDEAEVDLQNIKSFFTGFEWWKFTSNDNRISGNGIHYCLSEHGEQYIVYVRECDNNIVLDLTDLPTGIFSINLYNPQDDINIFLNNQTSDSPISLLPPDNNDWVYCIKKINLNISGNILYNSNNNPIKNASIALDNGITQTSNSDNLGFYLFDNLNFADDYIVNVSKQIDSDIGDVTINSYDAALIAQFSLQLIQLSTSQRIVADVNFDNEVTTYDAALIAQYVVGLPREIMSHAGEWVFSPNQNEYTNLNESKNNQNFQGMIIGNVDEEWIQPEIFNKVSYVDNNGKFELEVNDNSTEITIPFIIKDDLNVVSVDIDLSYNKDALTFKNIERSDIIKEFDLLYNNESSRLRISLYSPNGINNELNILKVNFTKNDSDIGLILNKYIINNIVKSYAENLVSVTKNDESPNNYNLEQNYPNPLILSGSSHRTRIDYHIADQENVIIKIYNFLGQEVKILTSEYKTPGAYHVYWDGCNDRGIKLSSGIYFYCLKAGDFFRVNKMILMR